MVECSGLENRRGWKLTVGSNPTLSATIVEAYPQSSENPEKAVPGTRLWLNLAY